MPACNPQTKLVVSDTAHAAKVVAQVIIGAVQRRTEQGHRPVLGLSADHATQPVYAELASRHRAGEADFQNVVFFNTDELVGLHATDPQSRARLLMQHLYSQVGVGPAKMYSPFGKTTNQIDTCRSYDAAIARAGGLDLVLLYLEPNGALGLVGPGSSPTVGTRMVILPIEARVAMAGDFPSFEKVPTHALSIGLATIMAARQVVLLAIGQERAEAVEALLEGEVVSQWPCSLLQKHSAVTVICDDAAASSESIIPAEHSIQSLHAGLYPGTLRRLATPSRLLIQGDQHPHHEVKLEGLAKDVFTPVDTPTDEIDIDLSDFVKIADGDGEGYDVVEEMKV